MRAYSDKEIIIIPNGVDSDIFRHQSRAESRKKINIDECEKLIIFVGRFHPVKGIEYLIRSLYQIKQSNRNCKLLLVGHGELEESLRCLVDKLGLKHDVFFAGKVPNKDVPNYLCSADIFVLPSLSEGLPLVVLEAMSSGLPLVTTNIMGVPEIIEDGKNGFLAAPGNPEELTKRIILLLDNEELRIKIGANNMKKAEDFGWVRIASKLEDVYKNVLSRQP